MDSNYGKFKYGSNVVGSVTSINISTSRNVVERNTFDTGSMTQARVGRITTTISIEGLLDHTDTNGQTALRNDVNDGTKKLPADFSAWSIEPETPATGDVLYTGAGVPTSYEEGRADDGDGEATFSLELRVTSFTESVQA